MKRVKVISGNVLPTTIKTITVINILVVFLLFLSAVSLYTESQAIKDHPEEALTAFIKSLEKYPSLQLTEEQARESLQNVVQVAFYIEIGLLLLAIFQGIIAFALWKRKPWARIAQIVVSLLFVAYSLLGISVGAIVFNILVLLVQGWIASYLLFTPEGKKAFKKA
ncbi:MAG: hypothetical protein AABY00_01055 [Nanoarchaeota archaeon]